MLESISKDIEEKIMCNDVTIRRHENLDIAWQDMQDYCAQIRAKDISVFGYQRKFNHE